MNAINTTQWPPLDDDGELIQDNLRVNDMVPPGGVVRVQLYLMDGVQRAISGAADEDPRISAYEDYRRRICNAWCGEGRIIPETPEQSGDARADAYLAYKQWLCSAWRQR
jgi:hypothetical protein